MKKVLISAVAALICASSGVWHFPTPAHAANADDLIVFSSYRDKPGLFTMNAEGTDVRRLTKGEDAEAQWSPDRSMIAFMRFREKWDAYRLFVVPVAGGSPERLSDLSIGPYYGSDIFDWAPDSSLIVFVSEESDESDLHVVDVTSEETLQITEMTGDEYNPDWSPDGTTIAFAHHEVGSFEPDIYSVSAEGDDPTQLTDADGNDDQPDWSPDGTRIAFTSSRDDCCIAEGSYSHQIYVMDADGDNETQLTDRTTHNGDPLWSPDGKWIAYDQRCDDDICQGGPLYDNDVWVVSSDGTVDRNVTDNERPSDSTPAWSPDGKWIVFQRTGTTKKNRDGEIYIVRPNGHDKQPLTDNANWEDVLPDW